MKPLSVPHHKENPHDSVSGCIAGFIIMAGLTLFPLGIIAIVLHFIIKFW